MRLRSSFSVFGSSNSGSFLFLLCFVSFAFAIDYDPLSKNEFCRRHSHAAAQVGDKLYIDGGFINISDRDFTNYTNQFLLSFDLKNDTTKMPEMTEALEKPSTVPSLINGALWADSINGKLYSFGGMYPNMMPPDDTFVWSFDTWNETWTKLPAPSEKIVRPATAMSTTVEWQGKAYMLGGFVGSRTTRGWVGDDWILKDLLIYDMIGNTWRNDSGPRTDPRFEGVMVYVPAGDSGLLVSFGGHYSKGGSLNYTEASMTDVDIYDISGGRWYSATAGGDVPESRRRFCAGVASAADGSSHNIYLFGGREASGAGKGFGDVYVLSLPSFTWIKWFDGGPPHNTLTCNVINNSQMLVIGGHFPDQNICDSPEAFGAHNLNLTAMVEADKWIGYNASQTKYTVPKEVSDVIGGGREGKATLTSPDLDRNLQVLFSRPMVEKTRAPTRLPQIEGVEEEERPLPLILGLSLGVGIPAILGVVGLVLFLRRRKLRKEESQKSETTESSFTVHRFVHSSGNVQIVSGDAGDNSGNLDKYTSILVTHQLPTSHTPPANIQAFPRSPLPLTVSTTSLPMTTNHSRTNTFDTTSPQNYHRNAHTSYVHSHSISVDTSPLGQPPVYSEAPTSSQIHPPIELPDSSPSGSSATSATSEKDPFGAYNSSSPINNPPHPSTPGYHPPRPMVLHRPEMQQLELDVALANALTGRDRERGSYVAAERFPEPPTTMPGTPAHIPRTPRTPRTPGRTGRSRSNTVRSERSEVTRSWRPGDDSDIGELGGRGR